MGKKAAALTTVFVLGSLLAGYVMFVAGKEAYRGRQIEREIEKLKSEAEKIKSENQNLREKITYLDTDQFRERVAKEKLNLKKEGEFVVEIRPSTVSGDDADGYSGEEDRNFQKQEAVKNYQKWWNQFFSY